MKNFKTKKFAAILNKMYTTNAYLVEQLRIDRRKHKKIDISNFNLENRIYLPIQLQLILFRNSRGQI